MGTSSATLVNKVNDEIRSAIKNSIPDFRTGDTVRVHARIVEGQKERIQVFEGMVIRRNNGRNSNATFTVRKISFNVGVERTFYLYSPRVDKIELVSTGTVARSKLFYLRPLRGKAARVKSKLAEQPVEETTELPSSNGTSEVAEMTSEEATQSAPA